VLDVLRVGVQAQQPQVAAVHAGDEFLHFSS
jgi:hypothetical protein